MYEWTGWSHVFHNTSLEGLNLSAKAGEHRGMTEAVQGNDTVSPWSAVRTK